MTSEKGVYLYWTDTVRMHTSHIQKPKEQKKKKKNEI
jgi:hypothetical protein